MSITIQRVDKCLQMSNTSGYRSVQTESEGYEVEASKHQNVESLGTNSRFTVMCLAGKLSAVRTRHNLMRELSDMPMYSVQDLESHYRNFVPVPTFTKDSEDDENITEPDSMLSQEEEFTEDDFIQQSRRTNVQN
ncbi:guaA [Acrasis kona]|uniref:GuaA n=1 Tax=Acrasis kona TaxID=1008807 RepID=A0AAW2YRU1_9EUKA